MRVIKVNLLGDYSKVLDSALEILRKGGVVVYPTDTVYGIGCNALDWKAVETVYRIKERAMNKPLSVIARDLKWVKELALVPTKLEPALEKLWPGALTVILPKKPIIPPIVTANLPNVGIRIPDYELTDKLLSKFGYPLISSSANLAGEGDEAYDINIVLSQFKDRMWQPDLVLDAGKLPPSASSTIIDFSSIKPKIIRIGAVNPKQLSWITENF